MRVSGGSPTPDGATSKEDEQLLVDAKAMATLNAMFAEDPLYEPDAMKRALTWRYRRQITNRPEAMPKFLKSVTWCRNQQVREAHRLVANWAKNKRPVEAIELLDERFGDQFVRRFAVEQLRKLSDNELLFVLPQLVQALKYVCTRNAPRGRRGGARSRYQSRSRAFRGPVGPLSPGGPWFRRPLDHRAGRGEEPPEGLQRRRGLPLSRPPPATTATPRPRPRREVRPQRCRGPPRRGPAFPAGCPGCWALRFLAGRSSRGRPGWTRCRPRPWRSRRSSCCRSRRCST